MYKRVRDLREDHDFTQQYVADILCVARSTYRDYEIGKINIPNTVLVKLADFYDTTTDYLLERTDDPSPCKSAAQKKR